MSIREDGGFRACQSWLLPALAAVALALNVSLVYPTLKTAPASPMDLQLRHNEVCCAHSGVNPFWVWTGQVKSEVFKPFGKDRYENPDGSYVRLVHAYPAWHTVYCWGYGWLTEVEAVALGYAANFVLLLVLMGLIARKLHASCPAEISGGRLVAWAVLSLALPHAVNCLGYGNYGLLLTFLLFVMVAALERNRQVLAGLAWAVMMIKPQCAVLLVFPLCWQRRFLTIATAAVVCAAATVVMAGWYGTSSLDLLLEIPQTGGKYVNCDQDNMLLKCWAMMLGAGVTTVWMPLAAAVVGVVTYRWRTAKSWWERIWPAVFMVPLWSYSKTYDWCLLWPVLGLFAVAYAQGRVHLRCMVTMLAGAVAMALWTWCRYFGWFDPRGLGGVYWVVNYFVWAMVATGIISSARGAVGSLPRP